MTKSHAFNLTGAARKPLIQAIESFTNVKAVYQGAPKFGYAFYGVGVLDKEGTLHFDCDLQVIMDCVTYLEDCGFACDSDLNENDEPNDVTASELEAETAKPKRKGIMDALVDALNENAEDGEHWERLNSTPQMECGDGRWRNLDGTFASNDDKPDFERDMRMAEEETTVTDDHGGEYDNNGEYIKGTGEAVCYPEDGMSADDVPTMITIELPSTNIKEDILRALIESKATLIKSALGEDGFGELPIEFDNGKVAFNWLRFGVDADTVKAWSAFLAAACKFSKTAKRVTAKDTAVENEKFAFRTFLVKIGMNDAENKAYRKTLLRNLKGDAAFATPESKAKWQAKHLNKREVEANETAE